MTRQERMLENLMIELLLEVEVAIPTIMVQKIRSAWKQRLKALFPQVTLRLSHRCDEIFDDYLMMNPPKSWNPQIFGGDLPKYLRELAINKKVEKYLPELADFEWSLYWVQIIPTGVFGSASYVLNPFVRYLKNSYGIYEWWHTKNGAPEPKMELVIISKDRNRGVDVFEPSIIEAAIVDVLSEMALNLEQLIASVMATLTGSQRIQVEVALNSVLEKGVVFGPTFQEPKE